MIKAEFSKQLTTTLSEIEQQGLYKRERLIAGPQSAAIPVQESEQQTEVLNFCANNYLGLADHPDLIAAAKESLELFDEFGITGRCELNLPDRFCFLNRCGLFFGYQQTNDRKGPWFNALPDVEDSDIF